jgi:hypothetical protein
MCSYDRAAIPILAVTDFRRGPVGLVAEAQ